MPSPGRLMSRNHGLRRPGTFEQTRQKLPVAFCVSEGPRNATLSPGCGARMPMRRGAVGARGERDGAKWCERVRTRKAWSVGRSASSAWSRERPVLPSHGRGHWFEPCSAHAEPSNTGNSQVFGSAQAAAIEAVEFPRFFRLIWAIPPNHLVVAIGDSERNRDRDYRNRETVSEVTGPGRGSSAGFLRQF